MRGPELNTDPLIPLRGTSVPGFVWDQGGYSRLRLSWQGGLRPAQMVYENIDPNGQYVICINGRGEITLFVNQRKVAPAPNTETPRASGESQTAAQLPRPKISHKFTDFPVPQELLKDRRLVVDWSDPKQAPASTGTRFGPLVAEVWLLRKQ